MRFIVADDEKMAVESIIRRLNQIEPQVEVFGFTESDDVLDFLSKGKADVAFLDIEMGETNGIELARECKELCPQLNIVFVTGYSQYTLDAFKIHASGYLLKPIRAADLRVELNNLRHPSDFDRKRVRIQAFGNFEIFVDGRQLNFTRAKCKECLAYLVDRRGARITSSNLSAILWEDIPISRSIQNNTQKVISDLMQTLKTVDVEEIITRSRLGIAIIPELIECDYFTSVSNGTIQMHSYQGEYMSDYSWAEYTLGKIGKEV